MARCGPGALPLPPRFRSLGGNETNCASASVCDSVSAAPLCAALRLTRSPEAPRYKWSFFVFPRPKEGQLRLAEVRLLPLRPDEALCRMLATAVNRAEVEI